MAVFMIVGLSRAVNRLSRGTEAVRQGDFGVRIPVRRRDQVGDLQRSFNEMAGDLETLVATAAQKESLEKELELARNLQKSLLPSDLPARRAASSSPPCSSPAPRSAATTSTCSASPRTSWR